MAKWTSLSQRRAAAMNARRKLEVEIPEWILRVLEYRVDEANEDAEPDERVELNDVVEWYLVAPLTVREVPLIEQRIPGLAAALSRWLEESAYEPPSFGA